MYSQISNVMKAVITQIGLVLCVILYVGCTQNNQTKADLGSLCFEDAWDIDSIAQNKDYRLVYVFNGNCSLCVMKLLELQGILNSSLHEFPICPVFIALKSDCDILSYNLERVNFKYSVIYDSLGILSNKNRKLSIKYNDLFLLDKDNKILSRSNSVQTATVQNYLKNIKNEQIKLNR